MATAIDGRPSRNAKGESGRMAGTPVSRGIARREEGLVGTRAHVVARTARRCLRPVILALLTASLVTVGATASEPGTSAGRGSTVGVVRASGYEPLAIPTSTGDAAACEAYIAQQLVGHAAGSAQYQSREAWAWVTCVDLGAFPAPRTP